MRTTGKELLWTNGRGWIMTSMERAGSRL
ncbi:unnamed protein product, partial [Allacma fusca]